MKKAYKISLISIAMLLVVSLATSFSYGVWLSDQNTDSVVSMSSDCLKIMYGSTDTITLNKPLSISDDDGYGSMAYPFTVINNCNEEKNVELRLDTLEGSTIENSKLKVYVNGDVELKPTILEELPTTKTLTTNSINSNLVLSFKMKVKETIRGNVRMWLSKEAALDPGKENFLGGIYFTTDETIIKPTFKETLLAKEGLDAINAKEEIDFSNIEVEDTGLHATLDTEGTSYYFRGNTQNNYVSFGGFTWRIIRINGNGSVRMILSDSIEDAAYNTISTEEKYEGYTYKNGDEENSSNAKIILDKWYKENITDKDFDKYVATEYFCNDSSVFNEEGSRINYQEYGNLFLSYTPSLKCGKIEKDYGNNYRLKVGLITGSETVLAGASLSQANDSYYLYNGTSFITMTPIDYYKGQSYIGIILPNGAFNNAIVNELRGIRPVINLSAATTVTGSGTMEDPYLIDPIE